MKSQIPNAQVATTQISVINESTVLTDADVTPVVGALQQQVTNDFRPAWGGDAELTMIPQGTPAPAGTWWLVILDDSDQAGALGYHDLTPDGLPIGKVFAASLVFSLETLRFHAEGITPLPAAGRRRWRRGAGGCGRARGRRRRGRTAR